MRKILQEVLDEQQNPKGLTHPVDTVLAYVLDGKNCVPLTQEMLAGASGSTGGGTTDPDSAREATLQETRDAVLALAPLLGSTDGLEALAASNRDLLTNLGNYTDGLESLLGTLNTNTDGIEGLLSALGVKDDNVLAKLEAVRLLLSPVKTISGASLSVTASQVSLSPPAGTTQARIEVVSGSVSWAFGVAGANTAQLAAGDALLLSGAEIAALRLTRSGTVDAQVYASYGVIG